MDHEQDLKRLCYMDDQLFKFFKVTIGFIKLSLLQTQFGVVCCVHEG